MPFQLHLVGYTVYPSFSTHSKCQVNSPCIGHWCRPVAPWDGARAWFMALKRDQTPSDSIIIHPAPHPISSPRKPHCPRTSASFSWHVLAKLLRGSVWISHVSFYICHPNYDCFEVSTAILRSPHGLNVGKRLMWTFPSMLLPRANPLHCGSSFCPSVRRPNFVGMPSHDNFCLFPKASEA